jgi:formate hydrogenlyase subunit 3/multisubunit Na+/H+ antiporter MnhD subunit
MVKKRELGIALLSFVILGLIMLVIMVISIVLSETFKNLEIYSVMSIITYVILGSSIGISAGFGYVIAQRLFDALLDKKQ